MITAKFPILKPVTICDSNQVYHPRRQQNVQGASLQVFRACVTPAPFPQIVTVSELQVVQLGLILFIINSSFETTKTWTDAGREHFNSPNCVGDAPIFN